MAERASEVRTLMPCPLCGRSLYPTSAGGEMMFHCKSGHGLGLRDLLQAQSAALAAGLENLLAEWERQHEALIQTVENARRNGHLEVATIFHRHAKSLESRIQKVAEAFLQSDSSKSIKLPDAIRSA